MSTEKEAAFPVRDFQGVDRQVDSEDIQPNNYLETRNLWEREIGSLETRFPSTLKQATFPSNIQKVTDIHKIYKNTNDDIRIAGVQCTEDLLSTAGLPANVSLAFVANGSAGWLRLLTEPSQDTAPDVTIIRVVGYGVDKAYRVTTSTISGYLLGTASTLDVTVSTAFSSNVTGIEVYGVCNSGGTNDKAMWCGFIDLTTTTTGTFSIQSGPKNRRPAFAGIASNGTTPITAFDVTQVAAGGTFKKGQEFIVTMIPQWMRVDTPTPLSGKCLYRQFNIPPVLDGGTFEKVLIDEDNTSLVIGSGLTPAQEVVLIAMGESFQTLKPVALVNAAALPFTVTDFPKNTPGTLNFKYDGATSLVTYSWRMSDYSTKDMMIRVADDGTIEPLFAARMAVNVNEDVSELSDIPSAWIAQRATLGNSDDHPVLGNGSRYEFSNYNNVCYFVSDFNIYDNENTDTDVSATLNFRNRTKQNYYITDGFGLGPTIMKFQSAVKTDRSFLPPLRTITEFEESIIVGGGPRVFDKEKNVTLDGTNRAYFTVTGDPENFRLDGLTTSVTDPLLNFMAVDLAGEKLTGLGIYTNTTADQSALARLFITKQNSLWVIDDLPFLDTVPTDLLGQLKALPALDPISQKVGCINSRTIVNSPAGTIISSVDNVYIVRGSGEPIPVGDQISIILKRGDLTNAVAVFHDDQYKLSFYDPNESGGVGFNNVEYWLDINRMKATKGQPSWKGPMTGRDIDSSIVEDREQDGTSYNTSRDRWAVNSDGKQIFVAEDLPGASDTANLDLGLAMTQRLETKDLYFGQQFHDWNKLYTRQYWKLRLNKALSFTDKTFINGSEVESISQTATGTAGVFDDKPFVMFPFFPSNRFRGRTIRKVFETTDRVSIGSFTTFFKIERRRI